MEIETFQNLPVEQVARLVRAAGPQVCVFPINGTRRWFILEHALRPEEDSAQAYINITSKKHIALYKMCFDHGLDTLVTPIFGSELLTRGNVYMQKFGSDGLARPATHPDFIRFYQENEVRVHFYGDYYKQLTGTPYAYLCELFDQIAQNTRRNNHFRLCYGVFANDATETIARLSVEYFQKAGSIPSRRELVELYYGEYIEPATIFIGFDKFSVFDYPLLGLGGEDIYFTVAPSLYITERQLRSILFDHIYSRNIQEIDYLKLPREDIQFMNNFYYANLQNIFGIGDLRAGIWYPSLLLDDE